jgi:hypothetical protein
MPVPCAEVSREVWAALNSSTPDSDVRPLPKRPLTDDTPARRVGESQLGLNRRRKRSRLYSGVPDPLRAGTDPIQGRGRDVCCQETMTP